MSPSPACPRRLRLTRHVLLPAVSLLLVACGGGDQAPTSGAPTAPAPPPPDTTRPAPSTGHPSAKAPGVRGDLEALYGDAAAGVYAAVRAHRAAADSVAAVALDAVADGAASGAASGADPAEPSRAAARALASRGTAPREAAWREIVTTPSGQRYVVETQVRTDATLDARTVVSRHTREVISSVRRDGAAGRAYRYQFLSAVDVPRCPAPDGRSEGRVLASFRSWGRTAAPAGEGADSTNAERRGTAVVDGALTLHVGDDAELAGVDLDLGVRGSWDGGAGTPLAGGGRLVWPGAPLSALEAPFALARVGARTGDLDALEALGYGPGALAEEALRSAAAQVRAARATWQGGRCVEVEIAEGPAGGELRPGTMARIVPAVRSRVDGARVAPFQMRGESQAAGFGVTREWQRPYRLPYVLTLAPTDAGAVVHLTAASRRGRAELRLLFTRATVGADSGTMTFSSEARYAVAYRNPRFAEQLTGEALATERVRSRLRLVFDRFENSDVYYRVEAVHDFTMSATAGMTASAQLPNGAYVGRLTATLDGTGTAHNPRGVGDVPLVQGRWVAPHMGTPSQSVGTLRLYKDGGRHRYELFIRTGQIAPALDIQKHRQGPCPVDATWKVVERYSNATRTETRDVTDPNRCASTRSGTTTFASPLTYGAISVDQGKHGFVSGTFSPSPDGSGTLTGRIADQTTSCEVAEAYDPLQIASVLTNNDVSHGGAPWSLKEHGTCSFIYALEWRLEVPPPYRQR